MEKYNFISNKDGSELNELTKDSSYTWKRGLHPLKLPLKNISISKSFVLSTSLSSFNKNFDKNNLGKNIVSKREDNVIINAELNELEAIDEIYVLISGEKKGTFKKVKPKSIYIEIREWESVTKDNDYINAGVYAGEIQYYEGNLTIYLKAPKQNVIELSKELLEKNSRLEAFIECPSYTSEVEDFFMDAHSVRSILIHKNNDVYLNATRITIDKENESSYENESLDFDEDSYEEDISLSSEQKFQKELLKSIRYFHSDLVKKIVILNTFIFLIFMFFLF